MGEILDGFVAQMEADDDKMDISSLLSKEEVEEWELLVRIFQDIDVANIGKDLKKVSKFYNIKRWQELSVLALVKMYEMMWKTHRPQLEALQSKISSLDKTNPEMGGDTTGGMFG
tara:strand:- start:122 stop:466 length:345 start_codon:yes stop_codon:yes gene_type:complete